MLRELHELIKEEEIKYDAKDFEAIKERARVRADEMFAKIHELSDSYMKDPEAASEDETSVLYLASFSERCAEIWCDKNPHDLKDQSRAEEHILQLLK